MNTSQVRRRTHSGSLREAAYQVRSVVLSLPSPRAWTSQRYLRRLPGGHQRPGGVRLTIPRVLLAVIALVGIGTLEARESARQIADATGPLRPTASGAGLTAFGLLASVVVYVALGWRLDDRAALRAGLLTGALAGLVGGALRAAIIAGAVADAVARYASVPDWFVPAVLTAFVVGAVLVSAVGGAVLCFAGVRVARLSRDALRRPPA